MLSDRDICKILNFLGKSGIGDTTELELRVKAIESLISDEENPSEAIDKFNEIVEFLKDILNTKELKLILDLKADVSDIPTNISAFNNDVPYLTENDLKVEGVDANGHDYVEIGGVKWATMNVGATSETDYGLYFQWGDTQGYTAEQVGTGEGKKAFSWPDYKFNPSGDGSTLIKYNDTDGKTELEATDDAVAANWGGGWKMPTDALFQELLDNTNNEWTTVNNVYGHKLTSKTDSSKYIFIPAAGYIYNGMTDIINTEGDVWASSLTRYNLNAAFLLYSTSDGVNVDAGARYCGLPVRGVLDTGIVDKYATKQELNVETQRAQTVEATKANTADLATVATTGSYNDLTNKPTNISTFTNDSGYLTLHLDLSNYATHQDVSLEVADLVDSAPSTLDTLNELAEALGNDPNFATTVATLIGLKYTKPSTGIPSTDLDSATQTSLSKADSALQSETDPTVPAWAKASVKPTYTYSEVGAAPIVSPALTGTPTAPTAVTGTNTTQIATTAFVLQETTNMVESSTIRNVVVLTLAEYDALVTLDPNTEYNIIETI